ncbi:MAG: DegT/DnrJ/EryC1/StrS aminotransferase family protein [Deltaproteobacteria bacterium]|nr:DegT/DnrJ/EryC1/StrS aminotransferase family protein [Deltaproteobacteria bacterium]
MTQSSDQAPAQDPARTVPAAQIEFRADDRQWIADRIQEVLSTGQLTLGQYGRSFEEKFAAFCGVKHAIAVNSGTASLEIALRALEVDGKDVLVPANTFFATAAAVIHAGGRPVLMDTDPESFGTSPEEIERRITPNTAGVVVVHIGGIVSGRMREIQALVERKGIWLVEDAAHGHGASFDGTSAGAFGAAGSFSFYPTKVMTSAEGGMITTNDDRIADEARIYRDQGKASFTQNAHTRLGYNWRMSEPHAIIGVRHLERLPEMVAARQRIAAIFDEGLKGLSGLSPLSVPEGGVCNYYKYIAVLPEALDRKALKTQLKEGYGVSLAGEVYEDPIQRQPIFAQYDDGSLKVSEDVCARHVCLPVFSTMTDEQAHQVIDALKRTLG